MSQSAHLEIVVTSGGVVSADKDLKQLTATAKETARSQQHLAAVFAEVAAAEEKEAAKAIAASEKQAAAAAKAAAREADAWNDAKQKAIAASERKAEAAEKAAQRQIAAADKAAKREDELWNNAIQRAKAGLDGVLPIRPSLQRIEAKLNEPASSGIGAGILQGAGGAALMGGAAGVAAAVTSKVVGLGGDFLRDLINTTREFDKLSASLLTVTGSSKEASAVFAVLQDFAAKTPYTLDQTVHAFVQLKNLGLDATERSLRAFGNMAAAFGDDMDHMLLAVGDAVMGINRPLKQFGIMAEDAGGKSTKFSAEGKTVAYTFRGVTTEVEKSASAIQQYLVNLSEAKFADAMENRMRTLDGQLSNVTDNWHRFETAIMNSGLENSLAGAAGQLASMLNTMAELAKTYTGPTISGIKATAAAMVGGLPLVGPGILAAAGSYNPGKVITDDMMAQEKDRLAKHAADLSKLAQEKDVNEIRALVKHLKSKRELAEEEFQFEQALIMKRTTGNSELDMKLLAESANKYSKAIEELDNPAKGSHKEYVPNIGTSEDSGYARYQAMRVKQDADDLRAVHEALAKKEDSEREFYEHNKEILAASKKDETDALTENETLWLLHLAKLADLKAQSAQADAKKEEEFQKRIRPFGEKPQSAFMAINTKFQGQQIDLRSAFGDRLQDDPSNPFVDETKLALQAKYKEKSVAIERERVKEIASANAQLALQSTQNAEAMFGSLTDAAKNWGGANSAVYKEMFAAQKAFGIASAGVNMAIAISNASRQEWPANLPLMIEAAADGAKILAMISSSNYAGAHDLGGDIPAGSFGLVGERGPELVNGPAHVTSRADTARMLAGGSQPNITIHNAFDAGDSVHAYMSSTRGQQTFVNYIKQNAHTIRAVAGVR